jgi:hypothetical protein
MQLRVKGEDEGCNGGAPRGSSTLWVDSMRAKLALAVSEGRWVHSDV